MWSLIAAAVGSLVSWGISRLTMGKGYKDYMRGTTGSGLTSAQIQQNEFTMQQQTAQQQFNAEQAALNRQWQERMSNTAYQRGTADMLAAGLNPAMMYGGTGTAASTPSGSAASSAAPAGSSPSNVQAGLLDTILNTAFSYYRLQGMKLENEGKEIENSIAQIDLNSHEEIVDLTKSGLKLSNSKMSAEIDVALQAVKTGKADELLKTAGIEKTQAESALTWLNAIYQNKQNEYFDEVKEFRVLQERLVAAKSESEINEINARIGLLFAQTAESRAQIDLLGAELVKTLSETMNIDASTENIQQLTRKLKFETLTEEVKSKFAESGAILSNMNAFASAMNVREGVDLGVFGKFGFSPFKTKGKTGYFGDLVFGRSN